MNRQRAEWHDARPELAAVFVGRMTARELRQLSGRAAREGYGAVTLHQFDPAGGVDQFNGLPATVILVPDRYGRGGAWCAARGQLLESGRDVEFGTLRFNSRC